MFNSFENKKISLLLKVKRTEAYTPLFFEDRVILDNLPRGEAEFENPLLEGSKGLEVLALSHTDFSDLFSVLLDAVNFPHMEKILLVGIHRIQVLGIPMVFFYFLDVIREATTLRLRWNPINIRIAPRIWSSSRSSVVYSGTTLSTLEVLEGLFLKILDAVTLTVCITFDSHVEGAEIKVTGLDKAFVLSTLGRTEDFRIEVTE
ncbi:hypothetical protein Tco_1123601 [Tanacetum coccineum]|uniref:Uncharacterized protein n=1 Tax=Tanacetum coccineum TaxID=301880 RepID=A0ABQ5J4C9_9ASTR